MVKAFVITIVDMEESRWVAQRALEGALQMGLDAELMPAITPRDNPIGIFEANQWDPSWFYRNKYSRPLPCMAAYLSHAALWSRCMMTEEPMVILEHDAVFVGEMPALAAAGDCCNLGRPSYGKYTTPRSGFGPLCSKRHFPGAHAYYITPRGAQWLLSSAPQESETTDVYLHLDRFCWLTEYYPWPVKADDFFTTVQAPLGCKAKHNKITRLL